jgi:hypothetical protein
MTRKVIDGFLLLAALVGGFLVWQTGRERARLQVDYKRLVRATGDLTISDPSKVHVLALETGEPLHFAWRVFLPVNYKLIHRSRSGVGGTSTSSTSLEFIARVRLREDADGFLDLYQHFAGGASRGRFGDKALAELLRGRFEKVLVEQLGAPELCTIDPDAPLVLLRLRLPAEMQAEAHEKLSVSERDQYIPVLFDVEFGPEAVKPSIGPGK